MIRVFAKDLIRRLETFGIGLAQDCKTEMVR